MMFADLVDEEDFRERLQHLGGQIPDDASPERCLALAHQQNLNGLQQLVEQLLVEPGLLHPEVRKVLEQVDLC